MELYINILEKTSTTKLNKRGATGSLYLKPLPVRKKSPSTSLRLATTEPP
jgi:hypothetical protein